MGQMVNCFASPLVPNVPIVRDCKDYGKSRNGAHFTLQMFHPFPKTSFPLSQPPSKMYRGPARRSMFFTCPTTIWTSATSPGLKRTVPFTSAVTTTASSVISLRSNSLLLLLALSSAIPPTSLVNLLLGRSSRAYRICRSVFSPVILSRMTSGI